MAFPEYISVSLFVLLATGGAGQVVFLERPESQRVDLGSSARLNCTADDTLAVSSFQQWLFRGSAVSPAEGEVVIARDYLLLLSVSWSHIGEYTCVLTVPPGTSYSASATVNITGYVKPFVMAVEGVSTFSHMLGEELRIVCPISGHPGPSSFHWQDLEGGGDNVTNDTSVESGAFVDAQGQLDVSRVQTAGSQLFACVGVDPVENSARTRIRVTSVDPQEGEEKQKVNLTEWYFILTYSVGALLVVVGLAVVLFVCWLSRDQCCERVARSKPTRVRVRRSRVTLDDMA